MTYTIYTNTTCDGCKYVIDLLTDLELDHVELRLGEDYTPEEFTDKFGESPCPGILKDGLLLGSTGSLMSDLEEEGLVHRRVVTEDDLPDELDRTNTSF